MLTLKNIFRISILLLAVTVLDSSCTSDKPKETETTKTSDKESLFNGYPHSLDSILRSKEGIIHGIELGEKLNDVKIREGKKPDEMDVDYCLYNHKIDSISNYAVAYSFVNDSLAEIEVIIKSSSLDSGAEILNALKKYYRDKYTAPLMDKGVYVFNCFDSKKKNFTISISDNSTMETGIIDVLIYREK